MQTDFKTTAGLFAYLFARLMTSVLSVGVKDTKKPPSLFSDERFFIFF